MNAIEWLRERFSHDDFWSSYQLECAFAESGIDDDLSHALVQLLDDAELGMVDNVYYRTERFLDPNQALYNLTDAGYERTEKYNGKEANESETRDTEPPVA